MGAEVTVGFGFTVTVYVDAVPTQLPVVEVGVMLYTTAIGAVVVLVNVSVIGVVVPEPAVAGVIPVTTGLAQAYVDGTVLVIAWLCAAPEQIDAVVAATTGVGLTVNV